jgi:hypothetical protein
MDAANGLGHNIGLSHSHKIYHIVSSFVSHLQLTIIIFISFIQVPLLVVGVCTPTVLATLVPVPTTSESFVIIGGVCVHA